MKKNIVYEHLNIYMCIIVYFHEHTLLLNLEKTQDVPLRFLGYIAIIVSV